MNLAISKTSLKVETASDGYKTVDPKTQLPHPVQRILLAMEEGKIKIDEFKDEQLQLDEIIKKLQPLLPIKRKDKENE